MNMGNRLAQLPLNNPACPNSPTAKKHIRPRTSPEGSSASWPRSPSREKEPSEILPGRHSSSERQGIGYTATLQSNKAGGRSHQWVLRGDNCARGPKQGRNRERAGAIWTRPVHIWLGGGEGDNRFQILGQCEPPDILPAGTRHRDDFRGGFAEATKLPTPGMPGGEPFGVPAFVGMTIGYRNGFLQLSRSV